MKAWKLRRYSIVTSITALVIGTFSFNANSKLDDSCTINILNRTVQVSELATD